MELHPALKLDYHALAALFARAFDGYAVPIAIDGASLEAKARVEASDLAASVTCLQNFTRRLSTR